jgi:hypothetical protein
MIMTPPTDILCVHCNAALTARDLADGWCDSCGKRLPTGTRPAARPTPEPVLAHPGASRKWALVLGGIACALLSVAAAVAVAG